MHIAVDGRVVLVDGDAVGRIIARSFPEHHTLVGILRIHLHPLPRCCVVAAGQSERRAELQEVHPLHVVLEPRFFRHHPTEAHGGESSPIVLGCKLRGSVRTEQELKEIFTGVGIVDAPDVRQCSALAARESGRHLTRGGVVLPGGKLVWILALTREIFALGFRLLDGKECLHMVQTEVAGILGREVDLVVVRAGH